MFRKICLLSFILTIIFLSACTQQEEKTYKIGIITLLTGDFSSLGENIVQAAEIAVENTDSEYVFEIVVEDAPCTNSRFSVNGARKMIDTDKVQAIIGGTCSGDTLAIAPIINEKKVVYLTPVTGGDNIDNAGEYVFRIANSDLQAGIQPAKDFTEIFGYKNVALVTDNAEYTLDIQKTFKANYEGNIVFDEVVPMETKDFRTVILKMMEENPEAVMFSSQLGTTGGYFLKQLRELGYEIPMFTTFTTVVSEQAIDIAGESLDGVYFYDPEYNVEKTEWLTQKYQEKYSTDPFIPFHSAATFDSVQMVIKAANEVGYDGEAIHDWLLENVQNWDGMVGVINLDEKGNTDTGFTLKQVKEGEFVFVQ